jgi:hypothetical protein
MASTPIRAGEAERGFLFIGDREDQTPLRHLPSSWTRLSQLPEELCGPREWISCRHAGLVFSSSTVQDMRADIFRWTTITLV